MSDKPIVKILYPGPDFLVTRDQLEYSSEIAIREIYRNFSQYGLFLKPGILAVRIDDDILMPTVTSNGVSVSPGFAVTYNGQVISVFNSIDLDVDLSQHVGDTLFIRYSTVVTDTLRTRTPSSGYYESVTVEKSNSSDILFWVSDYDPSFDSNLNQYPDSVPLGKLIQVVGAYSFLIGDGYRRLALPKIPFIAGGHWFGEFEPSVEQFVSLYNFLACEGHGTRTVSNPYGLTTSDIQFLKESLKSLILVAGIPVRDFVSDPNKDFLKVVQVGSGVVQVQPGLAIDWNGNYLYVSNKQNVTVPNDNIWYYLAIKYLETTPIGGAPKDYYQFTLTTTNYGQTDRINLARVKFDGVDTLVIDERQALVCRGFSEEPTPPPKVTGLTLTTGFDEDDVAKTEIDSIYGDGSADSMVERRSSVGGCKAWIKASWNASTGEVIAYEVALHKIDDSGNPVDGGLQMMRIGTYYGTTPETKITFHGLTPGVKFTCKVRAIGRPPWEKRGEYSDSQSIIAGVGASLTMSEITLTEVYGYSQIGDAEGLRADGYVKVSWNSVLGAKSYEVYAQLDSYPDITTSSGRRNVRFIWRGTSLNCLIPAVNGEHWYVVARCYDSGGFPSSNISTGNILYGDIEPPTVPSSLILETGLMKDLIPTSMLSPFTQASPAPELAYIRAHWSESTDDKSGVAGYEVWIAPDKKTNPGIPDEAYMEVATVLMQSRVPPLNYTFKNLKTGVKYWVKVRAFDKRGNYSDWCSPVSIIAGIGNTISPPQAPVLTTMSMTNAIKIMWNNVENAYGYEVYVRENADPGANPSLEYLYETTKRTYSIYHAPTSGSTPSVYYIRVRAYDDRGVKGSISDVVTAVPVVIDAGAFLSLKNEIEQARGTANSLGQRLDIGLTSDGRIKAITEVESEIADARSGYATIGERLSALLRGQIDWKYVRIVAKEGGQYSSIQAAVNSITTSDTHLVIVMPGIYSEDIDDSNFPSCVKNLLIVGLGKVVLIGNVFLHTPKMVLLDNIEIVVTQGSGYLLSYTGGTTYNYKPLVVRNCIVKQLSTSSSGCMHICGKVVIDNCYLYSDVYSVIELSQAGSIKGRLLLTNSVIESGGSSVHGLLLSMGSNVEINGWLLNNVFKTTGYSVAELSTGRLFMANNIYNNPPNVSNAVIVYGTSSNISNILLDVSELGGIDIRDYNKYEP